MADRCGSCPVILDFSGKFFAGDISVEIFLHHSTQNGVVIIGIIIVVRDQFSFIYIMFYISAKVIGAGYFVVSERRDAGTGIGDKEFAFIIGV